MSTTGRTSDDASGETLAAVYTRISRDRARDGLGVERQQFECQALAKAKGWRVLAEFSDDDRSAYSGKARPGYNALMDAVRRGEVGAVVAWHPDRLHRRVSELESFVADIESAGVEVATVVGGLYDLTTATGRMSARVVGVVAQHESEHKSERLKAKHDELARAGRWSGGRRPFGYDIRRTPEGQPVKDGRLYVVEAEAEVIRDLANRVRAGESLYSLVKDLNEKAVPSAQGKPWRTATLRRILTAPTVYGRREHSGVDVGKAQWDSILDPAEAEEIRRALSRSNRVRPVRVALLSGGLARCGQPGCGAALITQRRQNGTRVYVCPSSVDREGCGRLSIVAEPTEQVLAAAILAALVGPGLRDLLGRVRGGKRVAKLVEADEALLLELMEDRAELRISRAEWEAARTTVVARLETNRAALLGDARSRVLRGLPTTLPALAEAWEEWTLDRQRAIVAAVIHSVTIAPAVRRGPQFDPDRVLAGISWSV